MTRIPSLIFCRFRGRNGCTIRGAEYKIISCSIETRLLAMALEGGQVGHKDFRVAVITISDMGSTGEREDVSGPTATKILTEAGMFVERTGIIPDEREQISTLLIELSDLADFDLVVTTGGTGFAPRDVTPEATADVIDRRADGLSELMRLESLKVTPTAALSRGICGIRGQTLIVNLPGSPKAVEENLRAVLKVLDHGLILLKGGKLH